MSIGILIADKLAPEGAAFLKNQPGVAVTTQTGLSGDDLAAALADHDGVVVRSAVKITEDLLEETMHRSGVLLKGIARAGVGVDNINLDAATRYGIAVMNSASASTITTAEHAFALMMALARNIPPACAVMKSGGWDRAKFAGVQLHGRTLGVVGMGRIGQTMASRALAFGMEAVGFDPYFSGETALDGRVRMFSSFEEMLPHIDIVTFHVPGNEQTRGMLGREQFGLARRHLLVVNAARGGIVDEKALLEALDPNGAISGGGAAIDVYPQEPPAEDDPLRSHPRIITTPHLGASTAEAQEQVAVDACKALLMYLKGEGLMGAVNAGGLNLDMDERQRGFADLIGRMVVLLDAAAGLPAFEKVRVSVRGRSLAGKADTMGHAALTALLQGRLDEPVTVINAAHIAEARGIQLDTVIESHEGEDRIRIELTGGGNDLRVDGAIYEDGQPRITNLLGYPLDMVPVGPMVILTNDDTPGMIGVVGGCFGEHGVNIAEMVIGRKPDAEGGDQVAMMILKVDEGLAEGLVESLRETEGIRDLAMVELGGVS